MIEMFFEFLAQIRKKMERKRNEEELFNKPFMKYLFETIRQKQEANDKYYWGETAKDYEKYLQKYIR